ncbi:MAG: hypothetical protein WBZ29_05775 [Methanocella sp.]
MANIYPPDIAELDQKYQKEPTIQNELALEKAKLKYYEAQLKADPGDKELERRVNFHREEVIRLEYEVTIA